MAAVSFTLRAGAVVVAAAFGGRSLWEKSAGGQGCFLGNTPGFAGNTF
jgi:hypothetical protein